MRTKDIYMLNTYMKALGILTRNFAVHLGPGWKKWTPYHVSKVKALIQKRIDLLTTEGKQVPLCGEMANLWWNALSRIEQAETFERELIKRHGSMTLAVLRDLADANETTTRNIEKAMRAEGWKRTKVKGIVWWKSMRLER